MRILIALLLLLLAGGVWLALKDGEDRGRRPERTGAALPEAEPEREPPSEVEAETSPVEAPEAVPLRGKIVMDHGRALIEVRAHVTRHGVSEEVVRGEAQASLPFEIDVARLLAIECVEELELRVEHPDYMPARVRVLVCRRWTVASQGCGRSLAEGPYELGPAASLH